MEQAIIKLELSVPAVQDAGSDELAVALQQIKEFANQIAPLETEIKDEISKRVTDGQEVPGWGLQIREGRREVADVAELYQWWCDEGLPPAEFVKLAKPAVTKLSKRYAALMASAGNSKTTAEARFRLHTEDAKLIVRGEDTTAVVQLKPKKEADNG